MYLVDKPLFEHLRVTWAGDEVLYSSNWPVVVAYHQNYRDIPQKGFESLGVSLPKLQSWHFQ